MYLPEPERKETMSAYGYDPIQEDGHYQVEPDTYIYLFRDNDKRYILIAADYLDFNFDVFPHLLRFNNSKFTKMDFILQREVPVKNSPLKEKAAGTILFEYTN